MPARKSAKKKATTKKPPRKPTATVETPLNAIVVEQLLKLLTARMSDAVVCEVAIQKLGLTPELAVTHITEAKRLLLGAADYNVVEELGRAILRLTNIFTHSEKMQDSKTALAAQKELHEVFQFKNRIAKLEESQTASNPEADAIRLHLLPLKLAPDHAPLAEHVRVAGLRLSED